METATTLAFVGAGSLGQSYAALLAKDGQAVALFATPHTADRLLREGRIRLHGVANVEVPVAPAPAPAGTVGVTTDPAALPEGCGLIFLTKGHQLAGAIDAVRAAWPAPGDETAWVAGFQNGVAKDDMLARAFGEDRVVGGACILGAEREADGAVTVTSLGMTFLGELSGEKSDRVTRAVATLRAAEIPAEEPEDIRGVLWSKACNAAGVFGVSVLTRTTAPQLFRDPDLMRAYLTLIRETAAIGAACGVTVGDFPGFPPIRTYVEQPDAETLATLPSGPNPRTGSLPSMTQDLLAGRGMEVDQVFGDLVDRAHRTGVAAPCLILVRDLLRGLDRLQQEEGT